MLRRAYEEDRLKINEYLYERPVINLFLIADIEQYGFENDIQKIYIDEDDAIHGIVLIYRTNMVIQSYEGRVYQKEVDEMIKEYGITDINGEKSIIEKYHFEGFNSCHNCHYASCEKVDLPADTSMVEKLGEQDADGIVDVLAQIFPDKPFRKEMVLETMRGGYYRYYGIKEDGRLVSTASTSAETSKMAMVGSVGTLKEYRDKGYARKVVGKLTYDLIEEGKIPCLFYFNPSAARIYLSLGYKECGEYLIYSMERN